MGITDEFTSAVLAQIKAERAAQDMTQDGLAIAAGIPPRTYARYETGGREMTLRQVDAVAIALGLDLETLLQRARQRQG